jgi:uncharacterized protein (DUF433 family)
MAYVLNRAVSGILCYPGALLVEMDMEDIDWSQCEDVERIQGKVSGQWIVVGTRILATCVTDNADSSPEETNDMFPGLGVERTRRILEYARHHVEHPHPAG